MGLDAIVRCTCFAQGLTSPPPVPITLDERGLPNFDLDAESSQSDHERYISWMEFCCAHPLMCYARERIGCWGKYEAFREALGQAGWSWFPTLTRELPGDNSGETAPSAAAEALRELALFRSLDQIGEGTFLVDTATNEVIHYRVEVDEGVMLWTPSLRVALTDRDLVIIDTDFEIEVFRPAVPANPYGTGPIRRRTPGRPRRVHQPGHGGDARRIVPDSQANRAGCAYGAQPERTWTSLGIPQTPAR